MVNKKQHMHNSTYIPCLLLRVRLPAAVRKLRYICWPVCGYWIVINSSGVVVE